MGSRRTRHRSRRSAPVAPAEPAEAPTPAYRRLTRRWPAAGPALFDIGLLGAFWLLFFWPLLVTRDHLIPYDLIDQHYMYQAAIHRAFSSGDSPWWSPEILAGYPLAADPLSALYYPPNVMMHLLTRGDFLPYVRLEFQTALHFLWAAVGAYLLARALTGSRAGAIIAALTFAFGAFFAWHTPHLSPISSLSWLPWILLCYQRAMLRRSPVWVALAALAYAAMILAGHAQTIVQTTYLLAGLTALLVLWRWRAGRREALLLGGVGVAILALGIGLAMVQLLPSWELSSQTERASLSFEDATGSSYLPHWMLTAILPNFFAADGPAPYWGSGDIAETNMYAGLLPLLLAGLAVVRARPADRRMTLLLLGGGLLWLLVAFGSRSWLYRIAFELLPGVDRVRRPLNAIAFVHLALGLLAAYGVRTLEAGDELSVVAAHSLLGWLRRGLLVALAGLALAAIGLGVSVGRDAQPVLVAIVDGIVFAGVILLLAFVVVRGRIDWGLPARLLPVLLVLIAALDIGTANAGVVYDDFRQRPDSYIGADWAGNPGDPAVRFLQSQLQAALPARARIYPNRAGSIWNNGPLVWQIESGMGYSVLWPRHYQQLHDLVTGDPGQPLFSLLNIRYLVLGDAIETIYPQANLQSFHLVQQSSVRIYEDTAAGPRAWVAHQAMALPEGDTLAWMQNNATALADTVVLNEPLLGRTASGVPQAGTVEIRGYANSRVRLHASLPTAGWVVLADAWYPGWTATIDGRGTDIARADYAFRAVWVPAGEHDIVFTYAPLTLRIGAIVSAITAVLVLGLILVGLVRRGRTSPQPPPSGYPA